jgi:hypothetical protein
MGTEEASVLSRMTVALLAVSLTPRAVPLFDSRTLNGWEGDTKVWRVVDGTIVGGSLEGNSQNEFLATRQSYGDFVLQLEYRLVGTDGFVNSGVQIRSRRIDKPANEMLGYQADIGMGYSGSLYDESRRNKVLAKADEMVVKQAEKLGDWNLYEIRCQGPRIVLKLNGVQTVDYTETESGIEREGKIALQIHGESKAQVSFRNITIETWDGKWVWGGSPQLRATIPSVPGSRRTSGSS